MKGTPENRRGAIVVVVVFGLALFLGLIALVVDGGRLHQRKGGLQCLADLAAWSALNASRSVEGEKAQLAEAQATVEACIRLNRLPAGSLRLIKPRYISGRLTRLTVVGRFEVKKLMPYGPPGRQFVGAATEARLVGKEVALRRPEA